MKVKSESEVAQSCPTLSDPMDCSPPGSSVHGIFQARELEWGAIAFSDRASLTVLKLNSIGSWLVMQRGHVYQDEGEGGRTPVDSNHGFLTSQNKSNIFLNWNFSTVYEGLA